MIASATTAPSTGRNCPEPTASSISSSRVRAAVGDPALEQAARRRVLLDRRQELRAERGEVQRAARQHRSDAIDRIRRAVDRLAAAPHDPPRHAVEHQLEEFLLARSQLVQRAAGARRLGGQRADPHALDPVAQEDRLDDVEHLLLPCGERDRRRDHRTHCTLRAVLVHRFLGIMLAAVVCCAPAQANEATIVEERPLEDRGVELTIATPAFTAPARVQVFLPAGYDADPERRWPVTYYLHGAQGDSARFHAWFGDLIADYPSIVVAPDGGPVGFYTDWYNAGAGGPPMYETYDIDQLIPLIDERFRTVARRKGRALIGESMGGYGVLKHAARHPDKFVAAASMSGLADNAHPGATALMTFGPPVQGGGPAAIYGDRVTNEIRWRGHNPVDLVDNLRDVDLQVRTYQGFPNPVVEGTPDSAAACFLESVIFETNKTLRAELEAQKVPHVWQDYGAGCHSLPEFRTEFTDSLPGLLAKFADPPAPPPTFHYRSIEPRFRVWRWQVTADPQRAPEFLQLRSAGRRGVTLIGSGATRVVTPPFFRRGRAVAVTGADGPGTVRAGAHGRLRFTVDLGASETRRTVRFSRPGP